MHIQSPWLRPLFNPAMSGALHNPSVNGFVGVPTAAPVGGVGPVDQLAIGSGGAIAQMQMQMLQGLQSQAMFWMLPAMMQQALSQLQQQGLPSGGAQQGWPAQMDPQQLALLLAYWILSGGQLPNQGRSHGGLPSFNGGGGRSVPGGWGSQVPSTGGPAPATPGSAPTGRGTSGDFLSAALAQNGDRYVFGAEADLNNPNPTTFDCSELVQWAAHQAGVTIPDGSANQLAHVRQHGTEISVEQALRTPGALLFRPGHVAISLGDGRTIEAKGSRYGVGVFNAQGRFTSAGLIPGMRY